MAVYLDIRLKVSRSIVYTSNKNLTTAIKYKDTMQIKPHLDEETPVHKFFDIVRVATWEGLAASYVKVVNQFSFRQSRLKRLEHPL